MRRQIFARSRYCQPVYTPAANNNRSFSSTRGFLRATIDRDEQSHSTENTAGGTAAELRRPRSAQTVHLKPLKRTSQHGIPSCDLQLRSYSIQPLDFFSDFALRAAYYLGLPAYGPIPLPRITERWTVPRDHFIFKKSQENFERITLRRMIQIQDGNPETVQLWLAYLRKHQYYGVGMKANFWEFGPAGLGQTSDFAAEGSSSEFKTVWGHLGQSKQIGASGDVSSLLEARRGDDQLVLRRRQAGGGV